AKHPMLLAVKFWALAHLLANGMLVDLILFGAFLAWAVLDRIAVKKRPVQRATPGAAPSAANDVIALVGGLGLYALFVFWAHQWLFGVSPIR
ncbi:MAG: NnrU family protein, partial [Rhizobiales bacterium]|nr:NnrU family protein [Rhizobacter sp.]